MPGTAGGDERIEVPIEIPSVRDVIGGIDQAYRSHRNVNDTVVTSKPTTYTSHRNASPASTTPTRIGGVDVRTTTPTPTKYTSHRRVDLDTTAKRVAVSTTTSDRDVVGTPPLIAAPGDPKDDVVDKVPVVKKKKTTRVTDPVAVAKDSSPHAAVNDPAPEPPHKVIPTDAPVVAKGSSDSQ
jgi:hypothetical protein